MLNGEKFKEDILKNSNVVSDFSMSNGKRVIKKCLGVCDDCFFHDMGDHCSNIKIKWLLSEYKEPPVRLNKLEYEFLKWSKKEGYIYIVRNSTNNVFVQECNPKRKNGSWISKGKNILLEPFNDLFQFVQWEDSEPTSIKGVLDNCEVVEDAEK